MRVNHRTTIHAECPMGGWDYYDVHLTFERLVKVEDIDEVLNEVRGRAMFQEEIATLIEKRLEPDSLFMVGRHGNFDTDVAL